MLTWPAFAGAAQHSDLHGAVGHAKQTNNASVTQELMRRVRVALPSFPLQGCRDIDSQDHLLFYRSWTHPLIC